MKTLLLLIVSSLVPLASYANTEPAETLNWVGCGISKKAYVTDLAKAFSEKTGIQINIQGGGATKGIREVVKGEADLGGSCRYALPEDPRESLVGLEPVAWDALAVIVHKDNPLDDISLEQVSKIFAGEITNWKQLGGADAPIEVFTRKSKFSGVGRTFRKLVYADFDFELASTRSFKSSGPLEKTLIESPHAIAITGISSARLRDVKILKLNGIEPSVANLRSGEYLLYRPLYLTYNANSDKIDSVKKFISFCHSVEGRNIMKANGTLPYREAVHLVMKQIDQDLSSFRRSAGKGFSFRLQ